jgi:two-component system cell cycle sensor histidine kinase/response regulator CckA
MKQLANETVTRKIRILILEDVEADSELLKRQLREAKMEFTPRRVDRRQSFVRALEAFEPDIVLSDLHLPRFSGMEALEVVRERAPSVPLIIVTGAVDDETAVNCLKAGAVDYVLKDRLHRLGPAVTGALERKQAREERAQAEDALRESERKCRTLVDHLPAITYTSTINAGSTQLYVSPQVEEMLGPSPEEFIADPDLFANCLHPDDRDRVHAAWTRAYETGESLDLQYRIRHRDGTVRWLWERATSLRGCGHKPGYLQGIMLDITKSKEVESERDLLGAAIEQSTDLVIITDLEGVIDYVNPAFEKITGYSRRDAIGRKRWSLQSSERGPDYYSQMQSRLKQGEPWTAEIKTERKDGTAYLQRSTIFPIHDASGATVNCVEIARDITEQREVECQLRHAQKMEAVGQLTGGIAHDFNNILTSILANVELIASDVPQSHREVHQSIGEIHTAAQRGSGLVKKLMVFSRQEELRKELLDVAQVCRETGATLRRVLRENIDMQIVTDDSAGYINADRGAVEQILFNLATNAQDAMPDGGHLRIATERVILDQEGCATQGCNASGDYVCFAVSDTGSGMTEETKTRIFDPFFTTKPVGQGTGLGMAMVFGLMKQHGGFVKVDSEVGRGTTINIHFPVAHGAVPQKTSKPRLQARGGRETILLVEDETAIRHLAGQVLERYGYKVVAAADGEQALEALSAPGSAIDLVLTDVIMPKLGGWELYQQATTNGDGPKFLFTSGYTDWDVRDSGKVDLTMPFLSKPWTMVELLAQVRNVLDGKTAESECGGGR